ncbi:MAG: hypothetical protein GY817_07835 [bacterium]|nr:hypothetical protein [bacterium]
MLGILLLIIFVFYFLWGMLYLYAFLTNHPWLFVAFSLSCIIFPSLLWYYAAEWENDMKIIGFFIFFPFILVGIRLLPVSLKELQEEKEVRVERDRQNREWEKHLRKKVDDGRMTEEEFKELTKIK